jgi:MFS family permease
VDLTKNKSGRALLLVSLAVFLASATWFSGTAAAPVLKEIWNLGEVRSSWLTIAVQLGFIFGTFFYALLNIADVFKTRKVFFVSALLGALFNAGFAMASKSFGLALALRFLTGVTLAGVYPVGMKIVAQWFRTGLGWRLGIMVGALTTGTAVPYLFFAGGAYFDWRILMLAASGFAVAGGLLVLLGVPDGPFLKETPRFDARAAFRIFRLRTFRLQAFGYFGHMWELYAFWSLVSSYLAASFAVNAPQFMGSVPLVSFLAIGIGIFGCIIGGWMSRFVGERKVALASLIASAIFCGLSGFLFQLPPGFLIPAVLFWGLVVVSDSPQFSALAAAYCPPEYTGTALTIQNGIGFGITAVSIQLMAWLSQRVGWRWVFVFLAAGPLLGAVSMARLKNSASSASSEATPNV